ncbi:MAG: polyphosphate kinase 1 [Chitinophagaceae bacterium]
MYHNRDISWLGFNYRVLQEAGDKSVPLMERIKFLSIFSSNMDEFFRVRYPVISLYSQLKNKTLSKITPPPDKDLAEKVQEIVGGQFKEFGKILNEELIPGLSEKGVELYYNKPVPQELSWQMREIFFSRVLAFIQPVFIQESLKEVFFPESNKIYLLVLLKKEGEDLLHHAVVSIPTGKLSRFFTLETDDDKQHIVFLDDIIRENLGCIFIGFKIHSCYSFKITRDAELYLDEENYQKDILKELEKKLEKRDHGVPTRFIYEEGMSTSVKKFMANSLDLKYEQLYTGGRYHNLSDFAKLPVKNKELCYPDLKQLKPVLLDDCGDIFRRIEKRDVLLHFPYHSYNPVLTFFNQAAIDPDVKSIYVTLYRIAADSHIANALISAAKNKKEVVVFVELKARFDEANNIRWSKEMEKAGVKIIYSIPKIKVHSKIALVNKQTADGNKSYAFVGTGNFNETTARFYTDHALFTTEAPVIKDLQRLFHFLLTRSKPVKKAAKQFESILVSQYNMTDVFEQEIKAQIKRKKKKLPAGIKIKLNNLEDVPMIDLLYKAGKAGVPIKMIVRGICCLDTQEKGLNSSVEVKRIVDRFLEHSRIFIFGENGSSKVYMGSSDWMTRNLHHRIEVCVPVNEKVLAGELHDYFDIQWNDNAKASSVEMANMSYSKESNDLNTAENRCSQQEIYNYLKTHQ